MTKEKIHFLWSSLNPVTDAYILLLSAILEQDFGGLSEPEQGQKPMCEIVSSNRGFS